MEAPQFETTEEYISWALERISEAITNLTSRIEQVEGGLQKIPPPGPDMVKYKPPGNPTYLNLKELLDLIFKIMHEHEVRFDDKDDIRDKIHGELQTRLNLEVAEQLSDKMEAIEARLNRIEDKIIE